MKTDPPCRPLRVLSTLLVLMVLPMGWTLAGRSPAPEVACPSCDDMNFCTVDSCDTTTGTCRHDPRDCDDHNPCTQDVCRNFPPFPGEGICGHDNLPSGAPCSDGNSCTQGDSCQGTPGLTFFCVGTSLPAGASCDDGNSCTTADLCDASGQCAGTPASIGSPCDDHDACTSGDTCLTPGGGPLACVGSASDCSDGNPCTQDLCDAATGQCSHPPVNCDDGNVCTGDSCDPATGQCTRAFVAGGCEDGNVCTVGDACSSGNCLAGQPKDCNDFLLCTHDFCDANNVNADPGGCVHAPDNSLCPPPSSCATWICNRCTSPPGFCLSGCFNTHPQGPQECDNNRCTIDFCQRGQCIASPFVFCNDNNPCTSDACVPSTGACSFTPNNNASCSDGNPCTLGDFCSNGTCQSSTTLNCDDGNACTIDSCGATGCVHSDPSCDDGNICTTDSCDPASGCAHAPTSGGQITCGVGACQRSVAQCVDGAPQTCVPGTPAAETCNGIDDDCDGLVDENFVQADCTVNPSTINLGSQGGMFSMTCKLTNVCDPAHPTPIPGSTVSQVYISRIDSADDPGDDVTLPDPATLPCPDPVLGSAYERGISEDLAARDVSNANVTFKFDLPADGSCSTLDGNRQDIAARLTAIPDNTSATICITGKVGNVGFQACELILVKNKGLR